MGYVPGFSGAAFGAGLQRDAGITNRDVQRKQDKLKKYQSKRSLLGKVLGMGAGAAAGALLTPVLGPGGVVVGKAVASGLGSALGSSKMLSGSGPKIGKGSTGLGGRSYEDLNKFKGGLDKQMQGQALGAGAASLASGLTGMGKGAFDASNYGKLAPEAAQSIEGTSSLGMNMTGEKTMSGLDKFGPSARAGMTGYKGFLGNIDRSLTQFQQGGFAFQKGGYVPSYQTGGALGKTFSLSDPSIDTSGYSSGGLRGYMSAIDNYSSDANRKALAELGGMEHSESAGEAENIYQQSLGRMDRGNLQSLLGLTGQSKDISSSMQDYSKGQEFFRQQDPSNTPFGQQLEPMMNPFTGEPLGELSAEDVPFGSINDIRKGQSNNPYEEAMSMFPEQYQDEPKSNFLQKLKERFGMQMGGMPGVSNPLPYNMGGTVQQQPMAYQLGGLLKYNRSPGR